MNHTAKTLPEIRVQLPQNHQLIIDLTLRNQTEQILLLRPVLEDWLIDNHQVICGEITLNPNYVNLSPYGEVNQQITIHIPDNVSILQQLKSGLRFPGFHEKAIPIYIEIISPLAENSDQIVNLTLDFPLISEIYAPDETTRGILGLMSALIDLDKIPSRWLVAELLIKLAQTGEEYLKTAPGNQLFNQLKLTNLFSQGTIAFSLLQLPQWIADTIATEKIIFSQEKIGEGHLLYIWERWLWSLVDTDLEVNEQVNKTNIPPFLAEDLLTSWGLNAQLLWGYILIGLSNIFPPLCNAIETNNIQTNQDTQANHHLTGGFSSLETLPARWLLVEIILIIAQIGSEFAQTNTGNELLNKLNRTRFFKNGILALATAQFPRWLVLSNSATSAYQNLMVNNVPQGLIYTGEKWLHSLINLQLQNRQSFATQSARDTLIKTIGMEGDRWFSYILLGLMKISPRIALILENIANKAPEKSAKNLKPRFNIKDILGENKSLQR